MVEELSRLLYSLSISLNTVCFILKIILIFKESGQENGNHDKIGLLLISRSHVHPPPPTLYPPTHPVPSHPLEDFCFHLAPGYLIKLHSALKTSIKYGWVYLMKNMGLPLKNLHGSTLRNFARIYKDPPPKKCISF